MNFILCAGVLDPSSSPQESHQDGVPSESVNGNRSASLTDKDEEFHRMFIWY